MLKSIIQIQQNLIHKNKGINPRSIQFIDIILELRLQMYIYV